MIFLGCHPFSYNLFPIYLKAAIGTPSFILYPVAARSTSSLCWNTEKGKSIVLILLQLAEWGAEYMPEGTAFRDQCQSIT